MFVIYKKWLNDYYVMAELLLNLDCLLNIWKKMYILFFIHDIYLHFYFLFILFIYTLGILHFLVKVICICMVMVHVSYSLNL